MKKLSLPIALIALAASAFSLFYFQSSSELVYVDVNKLMEGYTRSDVEKSKFEDMAKKMQANVDSLIVNWQEELKTYEKERSSMSKKEKELTEQLLTSQQKQINNYQQAVQKQMQEEDEKATRTIINDINDYVKEYGKEHNYKIIFGASGGGNIMYAQEGTDLTDEILENLNKAYTGNQTEP